MAEKMKNGAAGGVSDLVNGPVASTLISFSIPFMLSTFLQTLYSTADTIVVGQYLGSAGLSAVSNGSQLMQLLYLFCVGFSSAGQVLIAQAQGAGKKEFERELVGALFGIVVIFSVAIGVLCILFNGSFLTLLATPEEAFVQAEYYIIICGAGMVFTGLYNVFSAVLRGLGDSIHPLLFVLVASVVNIILDVVFIAFFHWNVAGAGLASIIGQAVSVWFSFVYLKRHKELFPFSLHIRDLIPHREISMKIIAIAIPMSIQNAAIQFSFLFVSRMVNALGVTVSAAFGVTQKLRNIPGMLTQGLGTGCSAMIGQNLGARRNDRVDVIMRWGYAITAGINAVFAIVFFAAPVLCFRMFTQDETVLVYAGICILSLLIELPGKTCIYIGNALINAQGFVKFSTIIGLTDAFAGRVFLSWLFGIRLGWGASGFFIGYSLGTYLTAIPGLVYYVSGLWKKRSLLTEN